MKNSNKILIIVAVVALIGILGFTLLNKSSYSYSIEVEAQSRFALYFNEEDIIVKAKCLDVNCENNINIAEFNNVKYSDLESKLSYALENEINSGSNVNVRLASGDKNISQLQNAFIK